MEKKEKPMHERRVSFIRKEINMELRLLRDRLGLPSTSSYVLVR